MVKSKKIIVYYGSNCIVEKPIYNFGKVTNDYGKGFYLTDEIELAKEWACPKENNGIVNIYSIDFTGMKILDLIDCNILNWMAILVKYRIFDITTPQMLKRKEWLVKNYEKCIPKSGCIFHFIN